MGEWNILGRVLIFVGILIIVAGLFLLGLGKMLPWGRLPGDLMFRKGNFIVFFPLATSVILSIVLTLLLNIIWRR